MSVAEDRQGVESAVAPCPGLFPVTRSILSAEALQAEIARAYAVGTPVMCRLLQSGFNDTYILTTRDGRYIVRVYRARWRSLPEILYELELLEHVAARGISVSLPIAGKDGRLARPLRAPEGTRQLVLFSYAEGAHLSWDREDHSHLTGRVAGALHASSDDFVCRHARPELDLGHLIDAPLAAIRPFLAHRPDDAAYLEGFAARLRARAEAVVRAGLDWGFCHGDLSSNNIHLAADQTPTVIDFDLCGPGWRAYDIAAAQWTALYDKRSALLEAFLAGYGETRRLAVADVAAVPLFHGIHRLSSFGLHASNVADWGAWRVSDANLTKVLRTLREWDAEHLGE
jgi:Ser/Thr protein kinase RdoA (MazF antagonist)